MGIFRTKEEESIYKTLLLFPDLSVVTLASKTKLHRPKVYAILDQLHDDGLIETKKNKSRLVYRTSSYEVLAKKIEVAKIEINEEADTLLSLASEVQKVVPINSKKDIADLWEDVTKTLGARGDYYSFTTRTPTTDLGKESLELFKKHRDNKDLWSHVITDKSVDKNKGIRFNLEIKRVEANLEQDCLWLTYADTYAFVDYKNETGYIIKDARLAKFQQEIFRLLYKKID